MLVSVLSGASMLNSTTNLRLPKSWPAKVCAAMLHVVSLAKYAAVYTRSWAADSPNARVRWRSARDREQEDAGLLREDLRDQGRPHGKPSATPPPVLPPYKARFRTLTRQNSLRTL